MYSQYSCISIASLSQENTQPTWAIPGLLLDITLDFNKQARTEYAITRPTMNIKDDWNSPNPSGSAVQVQKCLAR